MFREVDSDLIDKTLDTDICIVGGGAAGITIAQRLRDSGLDVILLESGGVNYERETQELYQGTNSGEDYFELDATRLRFFGGSTNHWGGMCGPLSAGDFERRDWVPKSGWPISYSSLIEYYAQAKQVCDLEDSVGNLDDLTAVTGHGSLEFAMPRNFSTEVVQYSPPTFFGQKYRSALESAKDISVVLHANVLRFLPAENGESIERVEVSNLAQQLYWVRAKKFVLATGGIENARLLLLSSDANGTVVGNRSGYVGRCFMEHPHRMLGRVILRDPYTDLTLYDGANWRRASGIRSSAYFQTVRSAEEREQLLRSIISVSPIYEESAFGDVVGRVTRKILGWKHRKAIKELSVNGVFEQAPNPASAVTLSRDRDRFGQQKVNLNWQLTQADEDTISKVTVLFGEALGASGIGRLQNSLSPLADTGWPAGHHHMGTTRMSQNPEDGVVDSDCKVHEITNLYVAGSSVFSTAGAVNPTLTIVALALRLADHLRQSQ